jgi:hypothetical protein
LACSFEPIDTGRQTQSYTRVALAVVVGSVVIAAALFSSLYLNQAVTTTRTSTTTVTTTSTSISTTTIYTQPSTSTSSGGSVINATSFSFSPSSPVKVLNVTAMTFTGQNDTTSVVFKVTFENVDVGPIYYIGGCGSSLSTSVLSGTSVLRQLPNRILCLCAEFLQQLSPGQYSSASGPGCWSTYYYELLGHGSVEMNMTLGWSTSQSFAGSNTTSIQADFAF